MTIATTTGHELTIGEHIKLAYQTLGVLEASQEPSTADYTVGKRHLQNLLNGLKRIGVTAHGVEVITIQLAADTATYSLPSGCLDFKGTAMYVPVGDDGNGKLPVTAASIEDWQRLGSKGTSGTPSRYWVDRFNKQFSLWLYPDEAGTLEAQSIRALADTTSILATLDLEQIWDEWINAALAAKLAPTKSQWDKVPLFHQMALELLEANRGAARERKSTMIPLTHGPRFSR